MSGAVTESFEPRSADKRGRFGISDGDANKLLSDAWILVTNDQATAGKAAEFDIAMITTIELAKLIDGSPLKGAIPLNQEVEESKRGKSGGARRKTRFGT